MTPEEQRALERARRLDRHAFVQIALLCKKALETPPFNDLHRMYLLDIARQCKRALERNTFHRIMW